MSRLAQFEKALYSGDRNEDDPQTHEVTHLPGTRLRPTSNVASPLRSKEKPIQSFEEYIAAHLVKRMADDCKTNGVTISKAYLQRKLWELYRNVAECDFQLRAVVFTTRLTKIAMKQIALEKGLERRDWIEDQTLHPADPCMVPYLLQPPWLRGGRAGVLEPLGTFRSWFQRNHSGVLKPAGRFRSFFRKNPAGVLLPLGTFCCPGHCSDEKCIRYCFGAMLAFVHQLNSPGCRLSSKQLLFVSSQPYSANSPDRAMRPDHFGRYIPEQVADMIWDRLRGCMEGFNDPISQLAGFCHCEKTLADCKQSTSLPCFEEDADAAKRACSRILYPALPGESWW